MPRKTGRSRVVTVTGNLAVEGDTSDARLAALSGLPAAPYHPPHVSDAGAVSIGGAFGVSVTALECGVWQETETLPPTSPSTIGQYRYKYKGFISLTGQFLSAPSQTYFAWDNTYVYDAWQFWDTALGPFPVVTGPAALVPQNSGGTVGVSASILLQEWYDAASPSPQSGMLAEYPNNWAATLTFSGHVAGYRNGAWHTWTPTGMVTLGGTSPDPIGALANTNAGYNVAVSLSGTALESNPTYGLSAGSITLFPGSFLATATGLTYTMPGGAVTPDGEVTLAPGGGPGGYTLSAHSLDTNHSLPNYNRCSASVSALPDWTLQWAIGAGRYRDTAPIAPGVVHRMDQAGAASILGTGSAPSYTYAGGRQNAYAVIHGSLGSPQTTQGGENHPLFLGGLHYLGVDDTWADSYGTLLNARNFEGFAKWLPVWAGPEFQLGTLKIDDRHAFGLFADASKWNWNASGAPSLDMGALKLPNTIAFNGTSQYSGRLRYFAYRYVELVVQADQPNATFDLVLASNTATYTWHLSVGAANSWNTLIVDLGLPDATSISSAAWPLHPRVFASGGARVQLHPTTRANYWFRSLTGIHKSATGHTPVRLIGPLMCDQPGDPLHTNTPATDDAFLESFDSAVDDAAATAVIPLPGGSLFARLVVNGVLGLDLAGDATSFPLGAKLTAVWSQLKSLYDNDQIAPLGTATNDTGIHIGFTGSTQTDETLHRCGYSLNSAGFAQDSFPTDTAVPLLGRNRGWAHGYYGCGDPWGGGGYGATIILHADLILGGEICGTYAATERSDGPHLSLIDNPSGTVLKTATVDLDGFYRLPGKYGVLNTYSNAPTPPPLGTGTTAARKQFTSTGGVYTYTPQGEGLNYYSIQGDSLLWADSNGTLLVASAGRPRRGIILDRYASWYDVLPGATPFRPVDLAETSNGWVWRASRQGVNVIVERTLDSGATWDGSTIATDGAGAGSPHGAAPTLLVTPWDDLFCWYHDAGGTARCYHSDDLGNSWALYTTVAGLRFPRACWLPGETLLVGWDGSALHLYRDGATFGAAPTSVMTFGGVAQLAALRPDRHGVPHLVATDGTHLQHRYRQSDGTWTAPVTLANGTLPALSLGIERGAYAGWTTLETLRLTDETYAADYGAGTVPTPVPGTAPLGLLFDRREQLWAVYQPATGGALITRISPDKAASWQTPS